MFAFILSEFSQLLTSVTLGNETLVNDLLAEDGTHTVFVPTTAAFAKLSPSTQVVLQDNDALLGVSSIFYYCFFFLRSFIRVFFKYLMIPNREYFAEVFSTNRNMKSWFYSDGKLPFVMWRLSTKHIDTS